MVGACRLPGGRWEAGDESLLATALREAREELGFDPLAHGRLLGALGTHVGRGRRIERRAHRRLRRSARRAAASSSSRPSSTSRVWVPLPRARPRRERASPSCATRDVSAYAIELPEGGELVVWGITYVILERLRALAVTAQASRTASKKPRPLAAGPPLRDAVAGATRASRAGSPSASRRRRRAPRARSAGSARPSPRRACSRTAGRRRARGRTARARSAQRAHGDRPAASRAAAPSVRRPLSATRSRASAE